jgi:hypothetical protein
MVIDVIRVRLQQFEKFGSLCAEKVENFSTLFIFSVWCIVLPVHDHYKRGHPALELSSLVDQNSHLCSGPERLLKKSEALDHRTAVW